MLTNSEAKLLARAINAADGYVIDVTVDDSTKLLQKQYKIPARGRYALARTLASLRPVLEAQEKAHNDLVMEYADGGDQVPPEKLQEFQQAWEDLMSAEIDVSIHRCKEADLISSDCDLPPSVLAGLLPLISD